MEKLEFENKKNQFVIDAIISEKPTLNFSFVKSLLRKKDVRIDGKKTSENIFVNVGQKICVFLPQKKQKSVEIVFEDQNILIANKPQGMEVTQKDKIFLDSECLEDITHAKACHRLDKNTSGLVVMAKNQKIENLLLNVFKNRLIKKFYTAIVVGNVKQDGENLVDYWSKQNDKICIFTQKQENSYQIKTNYTVQKNLGDGRYVLNIELLTGKTHQIRAHLAHHGIFIVGDQKYGKKQINKKYGKTKQQLCANFIKFCKLDGELSYLSNKTFEIDADFLSIS